MLLKLFPYTKNYDNLIITSGSLVFAIRGPFRRRHLANHRQILPVIYIRNKKSNIYIKKQGRISRGREYNREGATFMIIIIIMILFYRLRSAFMLSSVYRFFFICHVLFFSLFFFTLPSKTFYRLTSGFSALADTIHRSTT